MMIFSNALIGYSFFILYFANSIYFRPDDESFYDFQINSLLWALGKPWYDTEMAKPVEQRHIILRWRHERCELLKAHQKAEDDPNKPVAAPMTGNIYTFQPTVAVPAQGGIR